MIILEEVSDKLQITLETSGTLDIQLNYVDLNLTTRRQKPASDIKSLTLLDTPTIPETILSSSGTVGIHRALKQCSIFNTGTDILRATISFESNGNSVKLYSTILKPEYSIQYNNNAFFTQGELDNGQTDFSQLKTDGTANAGELAFHTSIDETRGLSIDELSEMLGLDNIDQAINYNIENGIIQFVDENTPNRPLTLDLSGGTLTNGNIDGGSITITP